MARPRLVETAAAVDRISRTAPEVEPGRPRNAFRPNLSPLQERISGRFHGTLALLAAAVGFLMLLVSANISNLLLARASAGHKEMALRTALGAGRGRLVRQLLVESLALSCSGAALGLALGDVAPDDSQATDCEWVMGNRTSRRRGQPVADSVPDTQPTHPARHTCLVLFCRTRLLEEIFQDFLVAAGPGRTQKSICAALSLLVRSRLLLRDGSHPH